MDWTLELIVVPVSDVDRAKAFYTDQLGFGLDVDMTTGPDFRVVQLTPPGSACSIAIGIGLSETAPGTLHGLAAVRRRHRGCPPPARRARRGRQRTLPFRRSGQDARSRSRTARLRDVRELPRP